jgi:hypothetical protein
MFTNKRYGGEGQWILKVQEYSSKLAFVLKEYGSQRLALKDVRTYMAVVRRDGSHV